MQIWSFDAGVAGGCKYGLLMLALWCYGRGGLEQGLLAWSWLKQIDLLAWRWWKQIDLLACSWRAIGGRSIGHGVGAPLADAALGMVLARHWRTRRWAWCWRAIGGRGIGHGVGVPLADAALAAQICSFGLAGVNGTIWYHEMASDKV